MPTSTPLVAGLDLGSTGLKLLVRDAAGTDLVVEQVPTPWRSGAGGTADLPASRLLPAVRELLRSAAARLAALTGEPIAAIGISGMGESGMLINQHGGVVAPAFAWFDPRGAAQVAAFPRLVRDQFAGRTGLPLGSQVSVAKLALLRDEGLDLRGLRWLNLPEFVAVSLGGRPAAEFSLASRTGLLNQDSGAPWDEMLAHLGVTDALLPPLVTAGTDLGRTGSWLPGPFAGDRKSVV